MKIVIQGIALFAALVCGPAWSATTPIQNFLPGSVEPGVVSKTLSGQTETSSPKSAPAVTQHAAPTDELGAEAQKIQFQLTQIILEGNHVYTVQQLLPLYQNKLNKVITVAELQDIVQSITHFYRNNGYILSRAVLPPQRVQGGVVHVRIIEGFIDHVKIVGDAKKAAPLLQIYGDQIAQSRPLQISVMDRYLRLANEIPGLQVKAVLEPSKTETGGSDLNLIAKQSTIDGLISYDNYGTLYMGPQQVTGSAGVNSIFRSGDRTQFTYVTAADPEELKYYDLSYRSPFGVISPGRNWWLLGRNRSGGYP